MPLGSFSVDDDHQTRSPSVSKTYALGWPVEMPVRSRPVVVTMNPRAPPLAEAVLVMGGALLGSAPVVNEKSSLVQEVLPSVATTRKV